MTVNHAEMRTKSGAERLFPQGLCVIKRPNLQYKCKVPATPADNHPQNVLVLMIVIFSVSPAFDYICLHRKNARMRFIVLFGLVAVLLVSSCRKDEIDYITTGITLSHFDNGGTALLPASDTCGDTCYVLRINYISNLTAFYAVDSDHKYHFVNSPVSLEVSALEMFDSLHPAGSLLNDCFIAGPGIGSEAEDIIADFPNTKDYYPTHDPDDLWLMRRPLSTGPYHFIVKMTFDDGVICSDTSTVIKLFR